MKFQLTSLNTDEDISYDVGEFVCLGAEKSNHIILLGEGISERHARIEIKDDIFVIKDLRSSTGTYVNEKRTIETFLYAGDIVRLGPYEFIFENADQESCIAKLRSNNEKWDKIVQKVPTYAKSDLPILLLGESGTGKEVLSQALHKLSRRKYKPAVTVNCSALTKSLAESELFGHVKGAYTGATQDRKGAFEEARGGTLILDEVGDLPLDLQPKLLRAIENKEIKPVGSDRVIRTDCRIIACTHHDLQEKVQRGEFRLDLFFRLNVIQVKIPSLRERREDFNSIISEFSKSMRVRFAFDALEFLRIQMWPGNIRELKNLVARCRIYFPKVYITKIQVESLMDKQREVFLSTTNLSEKKKGLLKDIERELIITRLVANRGNQRITSMELGMAKSTLFDRIKMYGINVKELSGRAH